METNRRETGLAKSGWPIIEPKFDGNTFSFKVSNGEEILAGELTLVGDKFEDFGMHPKANKAAN